MPDIAKKAVLNLRHRTFQLDGVEFPWAITDGGVTFNDLGSPGGIRTATLTIFVEDVEVIPEGE